MKRLFVFAVAVLLMLSLSSVAMAKSQHKGLLFNRIVVLEDNPVLAGVAMEKVDSKSVFDDGKFVVSIPEFGIRASGRIDLKDKRQSKMVLLDVPDDVSGEYYVRVVVTSDGVKRVRHRLITIQ